MINIKKRIFIDLDGVIFAWNDGCRKLLYLDDFSLDVKEELCNDKVEVENFFSSIAWRITQSEEDFWENLDLFPWSKEIINMVESFDVNAAFLTSYGRWIDAPKGKLLACKKHNLNLPLIFGRQKWYLANKNSFLIDDKSKNTDKFIEYGGFAYRWPTEYNFELNKKNIKEELKNLEIKLAKFVKGIDFV